MSVWDEDWDERFAGGWQDSGGNYQSVLFMQRTIESLFESPLAAELRGVAKFSATNDEINFKELTIHEYGCAMGDGTALLQSTFPMATVVGYDWSERGVSEAKRRWPTLTFWQQDIREAHEVCDLIVTSHVLEHLAMPQLAVQRLRSLCKWLVVVVPPIRKDQKGGHEDAVPFDEWVPTVKPRPIFQKYFETVRTVKGDPYIEGSVVLLFQGNR